MDFAHYKFYDAQFKQLGLRGLGLVAFGRELTSRYQRETSYFTGKDTSYFSTSVQSILTQENWEI